MQYPGGDADDGGGSCVCQGRGIWESPPYCNFHSILLEKIKSIKNKECAHVTCHSIQCLCKLVP